MTETILDLIRHGEPVGGRRYRGHNIDDPLTEKGWTQMWEAVGDDHPWTQIMTSPLQRCQMFAHRLGERYGIPVAIEPRFKEVGFGAWEGLRHDEVKIDRAHEYRAFVNDPVNQRPQGAEVFANFIERVTSAYADTVEKYRDQHCLIVAHAGVIRAIVAQTISAPPAGLYRIKISYGGVTRIRHTEAGGVLELLNAKLSSRA
ncbi:MAG: alpha-ribazole phosphatase family protein [Nitrosomonas halophila]